VVSVSVVVLLCVTVAGTVVVPGFDVMVVVAVSVTSVSEVVDIWVTLVVVAYGTM
jgi:hypothetical protein